MEKKTVDPSRTSHSLALAALALLVALGARDLALWPPMLLAAGMQAPAASVEPGVRSLLQRYSTAFESLDATAVKKVQPSIPVENLAKAFRDMRELKVTIDAVKVLSADGSTARVSCRVTQALTPKVGSKRTTTVTRVMRLKREADSWVIDAFER